MVFRKSEEFLFPITCNLCGKEFLYCGKSGKDTRCYKCKKRPNITVEEIQKEIEEMDKSEIMSFLEDIKEYEKEYGRIDYKDDDDDIL